jgi:hypothetical protein
MCRKAAVPNALQASVSGHRRGLRAGHILTGVIWKLGRANCLLASEPEAEVYRRITRPGAVAVLALERSSEPTQIDVNREGHKEVECMQGIVGRQPHEAKYRETGFW